ncbi:MAG: tyrosine transporter [Verrucomicrobia bacterium]|nr:tyrosine transporter [Verrucomicrobiota bacterium]
MKLLGGILLVAGTTIGAGMIALPVATAVAGFWPSCALLVVIWAIMAYTAFLILEVNSAMHGNVNLVSMARKTLGPIGEVVTWIAYLLLLYSLTAAYISGSGELLLVALEDLFAIHLPRWFGPIPFVFIFGAIVYRGIRPADRVNRLLVLALALSYVLILVRTVPHLDDTLLKRAYLPYVIVPAALVITAYGFHIIIPSLVSYFRHDIRQVRRCLIWGSLVPLVVYLLWELAVLGQLPLPRLLEILESGQPVAGLTRSINVASALIWSFSLFAILTSYLGVSLSLSDFLKDGLRVETSALGQTGVACLTFIPPLLFAWFFPEGFILALSYGGIFVAILLGMLPIAMVWSERYWKKMRHPYQVWGGKPLLALLFLLFLGIVCLRIFDFRLIEAVWK